MAAAERLYREGSYALAYKAYRQLNTNDFSAEERRWLQFRLTETQARSEASSRQGDDSLLQQAEADLRRYLDETAPVDRVWAEAQETLGDVQRDRRGNVDLGGSWNYYSRALDYWAGSTNLVVGADKYWSILRKAAEPPRADLNWYFGSWGTQIPLNVLENALKIARNDEERARAHFMIAMTLRSQGGEWEQRFRIPEEFEGALKLKKDTRWYDDALYFYGEWMSSNGRAVRDEAGNWHTEPDFEKALDLFRRLASEFRKGETPWFEPAQNRISEITRAEAQVSVANVFLPESEIEFQFNWRNVEEVEFTLYRVDLTEDFTLRGDNTEWLQGFDPGRGQKVKSWKKTVGKTRPYAPGSETIRLDERLPLGAYVITVKSPQAGGRELLLVSNASLILQTAGRKTVAYACDAGTGAPLANARIALWERYYADSQWRWTKHAAVADEAGLARIDLQGGASQSVLLGAVKAGDHQAFAQESTYAGPHSEDSWKIYAFANKPAYRPGEKVEWKIIARQMRGETYSVPSGQSLLLKITDPRGADLSKEKLSLNSFGSAWGSFALKSESPLGEYQAVFMTADGRREIGRAVLFRMEEYKLPEFKVAIHTPEENGRRKAFILGEPVEIEIAADYYFGGPVANASVEAVVYQSPYYHSWAEPREFAWFYSEPEPRFRRYDPGQAVQRETLKTDSEGKAHLTIRTPLGGSDLEYRVEARVTDASRREISATDKVRVGQQRFYVYPKRSHALYRPQDKVEVEFRALDANEQPVAGEGTVRVTREYWFEIWLAPDGREVKGPELKTLQRAGNFPPPPEPGRKPWRLKFRGYQQDDILTRSLKCGTNGLANLTFTAEREGYYRVAWRSDEPVKAGVIPSRPIHAETTVWVATGQSADLGYRSGGLEILVDRDTFQAGQKAAVMLSAPSSDRYVLLTSVGAGLLDARLVHLNGSVKLLELDVDEKHVPNFFLNAVMVADHEFLMDQKEIVVPPTRNFLNVAVDSDRLEYRPGEKGTVRIRARDDQGKPVSAEVALTVFDESVSYIQRDLAGDPRQFFFGTKRPALLTSSSSFNYRSFRKVVPAAQDREFEAELLEAKDKADADGYVRRDLGFGMRGELGGGAGTIVSGLTHRSMESLAKAMKSERSLGRAMNAPASASLGLEAVNRQEGGGEPAVEVRSDFRSALFWLPDARTDENGLAEVTITYPDSLTSWKAVARAVTSGNQFGIGDETTRTRQPLIVRLQAPRFFLAGDRVTVSAVINNNTTEDLTVSPELDAAGLEIETPVAAPIKVRANGDARVDWLARPLKPGEVKLKVQGRAGRFADAMEKTFTVYEHGIEKFLAASGKTRGNEIASEIVLPAALKAGSVTFNVQVTPSLAVTMLDALPYLVDFPYGCTEQTMSRFLPAIITAKTLKDLGLQPEDVLGRVFGGIEPAHASQTHPQKGNMAKLDEVRQKGLERLGQFQHADGGWGWWKEGESDRFMTAYVVWGLTLAKAAGTKIDESSLDRAVRFLNLALVEAERDFDLQAFMLHALAVAGRGQITSEQQTAFDNLWENKDRLNAYTRALFALGAHAFGKAEQAQTLVRNLANGAKRDEAPAQSVLAATNNPGGLATAHWGEDGIHWRWSDGGVEATAFVLRALLAIDPKNELIEPAAHWLIKNRRGAQWSNTRDTAIVLLALNDYLRVTGEIKGELGYEVFVNGTSLGSKTVQGAEIFDAPQKFAAPENLLKEGPNQIRVRRKSGDAPIYLAAECSFFSLEEPIAPAGNEIFMQRRYYRLTPVPTLLKGFVYEKREMTSGESIASGDRIETVITIEAKNNYEYLVFEDLKPAGVEAVEIRSGESLYARRIRSSKVETGPAKMKTAAEPIIANDRSQAETGETRWVYQELRDRKVALFLDKLPEGFWEIRYESRAEIPGEFHALPVVGHAMYVPEIRGNSTETKIVIRDADKKGQL